ncbi:MAG TPA: SAM-dependent methyltransferase [Kofleriaceae bacterium]|nr:SAM-dependent methyltransferase [Kofleriaceae bacterium]
MDSTASSASKTALMVAAYRARASRRVDPVCSDPWAHGLAGALGLELSVALDRHFPHMELWIALRTAYLDAHVAHHIERGVRQVVLLGAGFDTRAARLGRPGVRFFEVDHPATQVEKRARLAELRGYPVDAATFVGCDFESGQDFAAQLGESGFDAAAPAVVLWEGVVAYLSEEAVRATLCRVAEALHIDSPIYFDYIGKRLADADRIKPSDHGARDEVSRMGEPIRFGINDPVPLLAGSGFRHIRTVTFDQLALGLTGTYDRDRMFRFQSICVASRSPLSVPVGA